MKQITEKQKDLVCAMEDLAFTEVVGAVCAEYGLPLAPDKPEEVENRELLKRWVLEHATFTKGMTLDKAVKRLAKEMRKEGDGPTMDALARVARIIKEQRAKEANDSTQAQD